MRIAFRMRVFQGMEAEYEARHNPIWPDLEQVLVDHGVREYSIFIDDATGELFAIADIDTLEQWRAIGETDVCREWWESMSPLMPSESSGKPKSTALREVFHIEKP